MKQIDKHIQFIREHYGDRCQIIVAIEEMAELTKELSKHLTRKCINSKKIKNEIIDVMVMMKQLIAIFNMDSVEQLMFNKLNKHIIMIEKNNSDVKEKDEI